MKFRLVSAHFLAACLAVAVLAACGGAGGVVAFDSQRAARNWIEPDAYKHFLIYAGGDEESYVFTFPKGRLVGTIAQPAFGVCSDGNGDVFFTQVRQVLEYPHGATTPIASYDVTGTAYSCSVDPTTGNLATVVYCVSQCTGDEVVIFRAPGEPPETYAVPALKTLLYSAYDDDGDLFVDGYNGVRFGISELARGASSFERIKLNRTIDNGAQIQWDGTDLAIETNLDPAIDRVRISGRTGKIVGVTTLSRIGLRAGQSWIANGTVAVPTSRGQGDKRAIAIRFWNYPAGGNPTKTFANFIGPGHQTIDGVTFSGSPPP